jgi:predicted ferric reductase
MGVQKLTKKGLVILILIGIIFIAVLVIQSVFFTYGALNFFIRLFGLWGYLCLAIAAMMSPFLKEINQVFGKPFIKLHHVFAFSGLCLITFHPVFFAIYSKTSTVFIPGFSSWYDFWLFAGRPALIILYIALIAILFRRKIKPWRIIHALMYLMLLFGFVHAILIGTDFASKAILAIFSVIFAGVVFSFAAKRLQLYKNKVKKKSV